MALNPLLRSIAVLLFVLAHLGLSTGDAEFGFSARVEGIFSGLMGHLHKLFDKIDQKKEGMPQMESRSMDELYRAALAEGGELVVYSGGDARGQQDSTKQAFEQRFPNITMRIVVDYSIYHGPRIDLQLEQSPDNIVPDFVQLQTLQDFARWKKAGVLKAYKAAAWDKVYDKFRDPDGFFTGIMVVVLGAMVNDQQMPDTTQWPTKYSDLLKPEFGNGQLVTTHPNFDDAILFIYKQVVDRYGWSWLAQFALQRPLITCGDGAAMNVVQNGSARAGIGGAPFPNSSPLQFVYPTGDDPFTTYAMYGAIMEKAKHPEAAKLYLNWLLNEQDGPLSPSIWSVRTDVPAKENRSQIWEYPNSSHQAFVAFMTDLKARNRFAKQVALYLGENPCDPQPLEQGVRPGEN